MSFEEALSQFCENSEKIISQKRFSRQAVTFKNESTAIEMLRKMCERLKDSNSLLMIHADVDFDGIASAYIAKASVESQIFRNKAVAGTINSTKEHGIKQKFVDVLNNAIAQGANIAGLIVVDSSSMELELIKECKCDVLVLDHHENNLTAADLVGSTAGGTYCIIDSYNEGIYNMSGAQVTCEIMEKFIGVDKMKALKLRQWAALSLFSDVIDTDNERNLALIQETFEATEIEPTLYTIMKELNQYTDGWLSKNTIQFNIAPAFNAAIRCGGSQVALKVVWGGGNGAGTLINYKQLQKIYMARVKSDCELQDITDEFSYMDVTKHPEAYDMCGYIASGCSDEQIRTVYVCREDIDDAGNMIGLTGSIRVHGFYENTEIRKQLADKGIYAEGHANAFGLKIPCTTVSEGVEKIRELLVGLDTTKKADSSILVIDVDRSNIEELKSGLWVLKFGAVNALMGRKKIVLRFKVTPDCITNIESYENYMIYQLYGYRVRDLRNVGINAEFIRVYPENHGMPKCFVEALE